jgi:hypothetical protein
MLISVLETPVKKTKEEINKEIYVVKRNNYYNFKTLNTFCQKKIEYIIYFLLLHPFLFS